MINLRNITDYSNAEIWQYVYDCIIKQGKASHTEEGACLYRGPEGTKCAVGHMITDEDFDEAWNSSSVTAISPYFDLHLENQEVYDKIIFLESLQDAHDSCWAAKNNEEFIDEFKEKMENVKERYNI